MWTRLIGGVLAAAGVVGASACAAPGPPASPAPATPSAVSSAAAPALSDDALDLATLSGAWGERQTRVERAMRRASDACLVRHGFAPQGAVSPIEGFDESAVVDLPRRLRLGYAVEEPTDVSADPATVAEQRYLRTLAQPRRDAYLTTLLGSDGPMVAVRLPGGREVETPRSGCIAQGRAAVFGSVERWATVQYAPEALGDLVTAGVESSPRYRAAVTTWRACLESKGFRAQTPEALRTATTSGTSDPRRSVAVAVADGQCALAAHLPSTALAVRRDLITNGLGADQRRLLLEATRLWLEAARTSSSTPSAPSGGTAMGSAPHALGARSPLASDSLGL